jgi:pimeloyl-ACP methyl ester carboxylesterase
VNSKSSKVVIYFHGIGEDLGETLNEMNFIRRRCKVNVIGVEYPCYGLNWDSGVCTDELMMRDAECVLKFVLWDLHLAEKDVILIGRSMGTGVASQLASSMKKSPALLVLIQPFLSINRLVEEALGPFRFIAYILKKRFETYKLIPSLKCPLLVIHGNKDPLVPMAHGEKIYLLSTVSDKHFSRREGCTHVGYDRDLDIAHPIADFMKQF